MSGEANELLAMMRYARPHLSDTEYHFCERFIAPLGARCDSYGNYSLSIGNHPRVLWSSHTDTVHAREGMQQITVDQLGVVQLVGGRAGDCLGADNAVGVWIMCEMARAKVPGLYVWHCGEEKGGLGSAWIADHTPNFVGGIDAAIAFDRRGTKSIITHQLAGERCCSDLFARALAAKLDMGHELDDTGVFTDTANYRTLVPECTNISAGYEREHGPTEYLDLAYAIMLRDKLVNFDPSDLPCVRDPKVIDYYQDKWEKWNNTFKINRAANKPIVYDCAYEEMLWLVNEYPERAAKLLCEVGIVAQDFELMTDEED